MLVPGLVLAFAAVAADGASAGSSTLEQQLGVLARGHKGKVAIAIKHLKEVDSAFINADDPLPTASLIKLPIMVEVYCQAHEGKIKLEDSLVLTKEEMVPGSGILTQHFSPGARFSLRDATRLMIAFSDNTATNMVLDRIGIPSTNARMDALGLKETRVNAKVFKGATTSVDPARTKKFGLGSTTAREMVQLLELLYQDKLASPEYCKEMLEHLRKCDDKDKFPRYLPADVTVAHKSGSINDARTDAGILYFKGGPVAVCVMSDNNQDKSWQPDNAGNRLCAEVAKAVYEQFVKKSK